jgi:hypothetical protein
MEVPLSFLSRIQQSACRPATTSHAILTLAESPGHGGRVERLAEGRRSEDERSWYCSRLVGRRLLPGRCHGVLVCCRWRRDKCTGKTGKSRVKEQLYQTFTYSPCKECSLLAVFSCFPACPSWQCCSLRGVQILDHCPYPYLDQDILSVIALS